MGRTLLQAFAAAGLAAALQLSGAQDPPRAVAARAALVAHLRATPEAGVPWDERVLKAIAEVPRHLFVPELDLDEAYADEAQPIGRGQTISQPAVVAAMTQALALRGDERVLEIGTGSGYQAAILSVLAREVFTVEIVPELGRRAEERLRALGYANVHVRVGDGYRGWPEAAPFDRILLAAAPPAVPQALFDQLADGGILIAPVGPAWQVQELMRYTKSKGRIEARSLGEVGFVPMVRGAPGR